MPFIHAARLSQSLRWQHRGGHRATLIATCNNAPGGRSHPPTLRRRSASSTYYGGRTLDSECGRRTASTEAFALSDRTGWFGNSGRGSLPAGSRRRDRILCGELRSQFTAHHRSRTGVGNSAGRLRRRSRVLCRSHNGGGRFDGFARFSRRPHRPARRQRYLYIPAVNRVNDDFRRLRRRYRHLRQPQQ